MQLKRHFTKPDGWAPQRNVRDGKGMLPNPQRAPGVLLNAPPLDHVEVKHTGTDAAQHFSTRLVETGIAEGWIRIEDGTLILYATPETLTYTIVRLPGRYSCFDQSKLPDDEKGVQARAYIAEHHSGQTSPDPDNPAGYYCINYYDCLLDAAQHARHRVQKGRV